jgi:malonate decarboxylase gamma subunit
MMAAKNLFELKMDWQTVARRLFPQGHDIVLHGDLLVGTGRSGTQDFAVTGTANHAEVGVEITLGMARKVLDTVTLHPRRPILFLTDTQGQRLRHREELLGLNGYMAHLGKCVEVARARGHRIIGLVYDQALSGGFIASAMGADICGALPDAQIHVMGLAAMARVTRLPEEKLEALSETSPVFGPGAANYVKMGAIDALWHGDLAGSLQAALAAADGRDRRSELGLQRGGRTLAYPVTQRVATDE